MDTSEMSQFAKAWEAQFLEVKKIDDKEAEKRLAEGERVEFWERRTLLGTTVRVKKST